ncbi:hypothetical protein [Euzebya sp.]|uniref:hypothetical protein n=1 Tax=Euzebya sp. TaxID=1971409 RepID=UPI0035116061
MTDTSDDGTDTIRATIYTRRQDAADAWAVGVGGGDRLRTIPTSLAAGVLAGFGVEGIEPGDVGQQLAEWAAAWTDKQPYSVWRTPVGVVSTSLAPADEWEAAGDDELNRAGTVWVVPGSGIADSEDAGRLLATLRWLLHVDMGDVLADARTVLIAEDSATVVHAAALASARGVPVSVIDRAYGILRAQGLVVNAEMLMACAAGIQWGQGVTEPNDPDRSDA